MPEPVADLDILLATWNGEAWLPVQLGSLMAQGGPRARILVRDDGSTDGTRALVSTWAERHPGRIVLLPDDGRRLGACGNFAALLERCAAPRVMFCDQDDRWHPHKIEASWAALDRLEARHGSSRPCLVHGDAELVDAGLEPLGRTLSQAIRIRLADAGNLKKQLVQNAATGCTMMFNRALAKAVIPMPGGAIMHDWWVALVAAAIGEVATIEGPLLEYRQHHANAIGAAGMRLDRLVARFASPGTVSARFHRAAAQADALLLRHGDAMPAAKRRLCQAFADLPRRTWVGRRATVFRHGFWMSGLLRNAGMLALL